VEELDGKRTNGVMRTKRFIPLSPQVADACFALDDERFDAKILKSRGHLEPRLATADNDHDRLLVGRLALPLPTALLRPRSELGFPLPQRTGKLWMTVQTFQTCENRVGLPIPAAGVGTRRKMPVPVPTAVENVKVAWIHAMSG
jgi:hypothetical protein